MRDYEITIKIVLTLEPGDDMAAAVQEYLAEHGVPEPFSIEAI